MNQISDAELEVMKVLWENGECNSSQIVEILTQSTDWKPKTIQTLITRLATKEAIRVDKSNKKSYKYIANISENEYKTYANDSFLKKLYNGSINMMLSSFIKEKKLSKEDIDDLKQLLDEDK